MNIVRYAKAETYEPEPHWKRVSLCNQPQISIEHFIKPPGHASPLHSHENAQVLIVLQGKLVIEVEGESRELDVNDTAFIPGGEAHVVRNPLDQPSVGIDIFVPGRSFDFWLKRKK